MKIYLPTEIGVSGEGSPATVRDAHTPKVHEVMPGEKPYTTEQPEPYKSIYEVTDETLAEQRAGEENTRNQTPEDAAPKDGEADPEREPVNPGALAAGKKAGAESKTTGTTGTRFSKEEAAKAGNSESK